MKGRRPGFAGKAVVLISGGVDSCVALRLALLKNLGVTALTFDYRKRSRGERISTLRIAKAERVPLERVRLDDITSIEDLAPIERKALGKRAPDGFIAAKNAVFYSHAAHLAMRIGARYIIGGHNASDLELFPDASPKFFDRLQSVLDLSAPRGVRPPKLYFPLRLRSKPEVVRLGVQIRAPLDLTWSCYRDLTAPCGRCAACESRQEAFKSAGFSK